MFIVYLTFISFVAYLLLITSFFIGWKRTPRVKLENTSQVKISVLIAARNEASNIEALLACMQNQQYSREMFEIIVVNDHSSDSTPELLEKWLNILPNLRILHLPENMQGKKNAIRFGIQQSNNELIVTTDADCKMGSQWLTAISSFYVNSSCKLIVAPLLYESNSKSVFECIQALESLSLVASGAGSLQIGHPIMCNAANMAFQRKIYIELASEVKANIASGDDVFLLTAVKKRYPNAIGFLKSTEATVFTRPESNLASFLAQRKRWTSKSRYYSDRDILIVAGIVGMLNVFILLQIFAGIFNPIYFILFIISLLVKSAIDLPLLYSFAKYFGKAQLLKYFWATQLIYPFYIVFMVIYGNIGSFKWKNRIYKETII